MDGLRTVTAEKAEYIKRVNEHFDWKFNFICNMQRLAKIGKNYLKIQFYYDVVKKYLS